MTYKHSVTMGLAAAVLAASTGFAMSQATGKENNATTGSEPGVGPKSGPEVKGSTGSMKGDTGSMKGDTDSMKGDTGSMKGDTGSMKGESGSMKKDEPTSAGSAQDQSKDLRGHSETPTTGSGH